MLLCSLLLHAAPAAAPAAAPRLPVGTDSVSRLTRASGSGFFTYEQRLEPVAEVALDPEETDALQAIYDATHAALRPFQGNLRAGQQRRQIRLAWTQALEDFVVQHPQSAWVPGVAKVLADEYARRLTYSKAIAAYQAAYEGTRDRGDETSLRVARESSRALARYLALTGETEALKALVAAEQAKDPDRVRQTWFQALEIAAWNARFPNEAWKCGLQCLHQLARLTQPDAFDPLRIFLRPSNPHGYTVAELMVAARDGRVRAQPMFTDNLAVFPVPAVVHLKVGHFVVVRRRDGAFYEVMDPVAAPNVWLTAAELAEEASGCLIVNDQSDLAGVQGLRLLTPAEMEAFSGRCYHGNVQDRTEPPPCEPTEDCDECPPGGGPGPDSGPGPGRGPCLTCPGGGNPFGGGGGIGAGMPTWHISEPHLNLRLFDTPMEYRPAYGPPVRLTLWHASRDDLGLATGHRGSTMPNDYYSDWSFRYLTLTDFDPDPGLQATVRLPVGGQVVFHFPGTNLWSALDQVTHLQLEKRLSGTNLIGFHLHRRDGGRLEYGQLFGPGTDVRHQWGLTAEVDPQGFKTSVSYRFGRFIHQITAADGMSFTVVHEEEDTLDEFTWQSRIVAITNALGHTVTFGYGEGDYADSGYWGGFSSITDAAGIKTWVYSRIVGESRVRTPYGLTRFLIEGAGNFEDGPGYVSPVLDRYLRVIHPDGAEEAYGQLTMDPQPSNWPAWDTLQIPNTTNAWVSTLDTADRYARNTIYWNGRQRQLMAKDLATDWTLSWSDFMLGRIRHWLTYSADYYTHWDALSWEQSPSPDGGASQGGVTWYDYAGKPAGANYERGTSFLPAVVARVMPDNNTTWTSHQRNHYGRVTNRVDRWIAGGTAQYRTNLFFYDSAGMHLVQHRFGPTLAASKLVTGYAYDAAHPGLPIRITNALNEVTLRTYDALDRPATIQTPAGVTTTYSYYATNHTDLHQRGRLQQAVDAWTQHGGGTSRTNAYTWHYGDVRTRHDPRGLTVTNTYDGLHRLTRVDYGSDGSYELYAYTNAAGVKLLDRTYHRDREGHTTAWVYDSRRRVTNVVDALGRVTLYTYCDCGDQPASVTRAHGTSLAQTTFFDYDYQGNLLTNTLPEGSAIIHRYDALGRRTKTVDAFTTSTNWFDNLGRLVAVSNALGRVAFTVYDAEDRPTSVTDHNGVTVTMTYDHLHRLRTRTYPDGGVEAWGYTANVGLATHHTNQLGKVTLYAHDALGRKTNEVQVGLWTNSFTYAPAGDLLTLTDGKNQTTTWVYDAEGRVKEKWYQGQSTADLVYWYDADGRLTNRLTRTGTGASTNGYSTVFHYDATGSLTNVDYPSGTADLKYAYDALGRLTNMVDAAGTTTYTYAVGGGKEIISEDGPWSGDVLTVTNRQGRRLGLQLTQPTGSAWWQTNAYDAAGRLATLASPAGAFGYSYKSAAGVSPATLVGGISLPTTGGTAYITNFYDTTGRLLSTVLRNSDHSTLNLHEYAYNAGHQRILGTRTNVSVGSTYSQRTGYSYDDAGQLTVAWVTNSAGSLVSTESRGYAYDPAQNLARRTNNASGSTVTATVNALNQLTAGLGFSGGLAYDRRGNLLTIGSAGSGKAFAYDHENQCVTAGWWNNYTKSDFVYDGKGRLRKRTDYSWNGSNWTPTGETRYVYDGMLLIQERTSAGHPAVTYTRGLDLSGTLAGAGGIGGLLARTAHQSTSPYQPSTHAFYHADGNGNVTYLLNQARTHGASYRYDPYGRLIASSGPLSSANLMRFSSKPWHDHSETYHYGYRFYLPEGQRWINRDPILEEGGINLYGFLGNSPVDAIDPDGRAGVIVGALVVGGTFAVAIGVATLVNAIRDGFNQAQNSADQRVRQNEAIHNHENYCPPSDRALRDGLPTRLATSMTWPPRRERSQGAIPPSERPWMAQARWLPVRQGRHRKQ